MGRGCDGVLAGDSLEMTAEHAGAVIGFKTTTGEKIDQWVNVPMAILATPPTAACTQLLQRQSHQATRRQPDR